MSPDQLARIAALATALGDLAPMLNGLAAGPGLDLATLLAASRCARHAQALCRNLDDLLAAMPLVDADREPPGRGVWIYGQL